MAYYTSRLTWKIVNSDYCYTSSISSFFNHNKRLNFTTFFIEPPSVSSSSSCSTSHTSASTHIRSKKSVKIERSEGGCFSVSQNDDDDDESIDLGKNKGESEMGSSKSVGIVINKPCCRRVRVLIEEKNNFEELQYFLVSLSHNENSSTVSSATTPTSGRSPTKPSRGASRGTMTRTPPPPVTRCHVLRRLMASSSRRIYRNGVIFMSSLMMKTKLLIEKNGRYN
ncbi:hypothetical protein Q3G72_004856 [Acer saccharum]|nr:hypothetical protein Q3G72_004856 [Acer saccharum]